MKIRFIVFLLSVFFFVGCKNEISQKSDSNDNYEKILVEKENNSAQTPLEIEGEKISEIPFEVKADVKDFEDGIQPWANIEKPEVDLPNLIDKDKVVISANAVTVIIDYPLTNKYTFNLSSDKGFTREMLLVEISKHYYKLYEEEEKSASVKTLPPAERKMYNRNETNGKYGIWGHDIADLVLTDIQVYKDKNGKVILSLGIDS